MKTLIGICSLLIILFVCCLSAELYLYREFAESVTLMLFWITGITFWIKNFVLVLKKQTA